MIFLMSGALIVTLLLGIVLALRTMKPKWLVWLMLTLGLAVRALCGWLGQRRQGIFPAILFLRSFREAVQPSQSQRLDFRNFFTNAGVLKPVRT